MFAASSPAKVNFRKTLMVSVLPYLKVILRLRYKIAQASSAWVGVPRTHPLLPEGETSPPCTGAEETPTTPTKPTTGGERPAPGGGNPVSDKSANYPTGSNRPLTHASCTREVFVCVGLCSGERPGKTSCASAGHTDWIITSPRTAKQSCSSYSLGP